MKTAIKRTMSIAVVAVMIAVMAIPAVSASVAIGNGTVSDGATTLTIPKGITIKNEVEMNVYGPDITYSYTIAPIDPAENAVASDSTMTLPVTRGVADGAALESSNVVFASSELLSARASGVETTKNLSVNIDTTKFERPGVYRYMITDVTSTATLFAAGIVRPAAYDTTRFLDVYIKNGASGFEVAGYTLTTENLETISAANKNQGYVTAYETSSGAPGTDVYVTYNVRIEKIVAGVMGDKNNNFPFTIDLTNEGHKYFYGTSNDAVTTESDAVQLTPTLKHGSVFYIRGLSPKATIAIKEENNTPDTYKVKIEGKDSTSGSVWTTLVAQADVAPTAFATLTAMSVSTYNTANSASSVATEGAATNCREVQFTNTLDAISPTGVVLRFAPFALLFGFAIVFLAVSRRTKASKRETRAI